MEKLTEYVLNPEHPVGKHKAFVFEALLGITASEAWFLQEKILEAVQTAEAVLLREDKFGTRYRIEFNLERNGRTAVVVAGWILEKHSDSPRLTSCYIA